jgi:anaerobic ribonucleoside-triphosphate reductase activating protein
METDKTIWCYTGYTWENLLAKRDPIVMSLLENLDVLVDGPFIQSLRDTDLHFRGSSNQRLIDVQKSLLAGEVILWQR